MKKFLSILLAALVLPALADFEGLPLSATTYSWASARSIGVVSQLWESVQERCLILSDRVAPMSIVENWTVQVGYSNVVSTYTWDAGSFVITNRTPHYAYITTTNQIVDYKLTISNSAYADWFAPLMTNSPSPTKEVTVSFPVTYAFMSALDAKLFEITSYFVNTNLAWYGSFDLWFSLASVPGLPPAERSYPTNYPFLCRAAVMEYANVGYRTNLVWSPFGYVTGGDAWFTRQPAINSSWILWQATREKYEVCVSNGPAKLNGNYIKANRADYPFPKAYSHYFGELDPFYIREDGQAYIGRGYVDPSVLRGLTTDGYVWEIGPATNAAIDFTDRYFSYQKLSTNIVFEYYGFVRYDSISPKYSTNTWISYADISPWDDLLFPLIEPSVPGWPPAASSICVFEGTNGYWLNRNIANYDRRYYSNDPRPFWARIFPTNETTNVTIEIHAVGSKFDFSAADLFGEQVVVPCVEDVSIVADRTASPNMWFRTFETQSVVTGYAPVGTSIVLMWTNSHFYDIQPYRLYAENINERVKYVQQLVWTTHTNWSWKGEDDLLADPPTSDSSYWGVSRWVGAAYSVHTYVDPLYAVERGNLLPDEETWNDYQNAPPTFDTAHLNWTGAAWDRFIWHWMELPVSWQVNPAIYWTTNWHFSSVAPAPVTKRNVAPNINVTATDNYEKNFNVVYRSQYGPLSPAWIASVWDPVFSRVEPEMLRFLLYYPYYWEIRNDAGRTDSWYSPFPKESEEEWQTWSGTMDISSLISTNINTTNMWGIGMNHIVEYYGKTNINTALLPSVFARTIIGVLNSNNNENTGKIEIPSTLSDCAVPTNGRAFSSVFSESLLPRVVYAWTSSYSPRLYSVSNAAYLTPTFTNSVVVTNYASVDLYSLDPDDPGENPDIYEGTTNLFYPVMFTGFVWTGSAYTHMEMPEDRIRTYNASTNINVTGYTDLTYLASAPVPYPFIPGLNGWYSLVTNLVEYTITNVVPAQNLVVRYNSYVGPPGGGIWEGSPYPNTYLGTNSWISQYFDLVLTNFSVTNVITYVQTNTASLWVEWDYAQLYSDVTICEARIKQWAYAQSHIYTTNVNVQVQYLDPLMKWDVTNGLRRK